MSGTDEIFSFCFGALRPSQFYGLAFEEGIGNRNQKILDFFISLGHKDLRLLNVPTLCNEQYVISF